MSVPFPKNFLAVNSSNTKNLTVVVVIDGITPISSGPVYSENTYGEPGLKYGKPGLVYGQSGLRTDIKQLLMLGESSMAITQKNEPEQGRAAIGTISLTFLDKDQYMSQVIARGPIVPEILGRFVTLYLGYQQLSFPQDYGRIFQGRVSGFSSGSGRVTLQISDPNLVNKQQIFYPANTVLNLNDGSFNFQGAGNGPLSQVAFGNDAFLNCYRATVTSVPGTGLSNWQIISEFSGALGTASITTVGGSFTFTSGGLTITVTAGPTDFQVGDYFRITPSQVGVFVGKGNGVIAVTAIPSITYTVTCTGVTSPNQSTWSVSKIGTGVIATFSINSLFVGGQGSFNVGGELSGTVTSGTTPFQVGDIFTVTTGASAIVVGSLASFAQLPFIPGQSGFYDSAVKLYLKIDSEWIEYGPSEDLSAGGFDIATGILTFLVRGARSTPAQVIAGNNYGIATHAIGATVTTGVQIQDNGMLFALKSMLSGWGGPFQSGVPISSIVDTGDVTLGSIPNAIILPPGIDAVLDYGLSIGDVITITGSGISGNNVTEIPIRDILDFNLELNRIIILGTGATLAAENPSSAELALRSQYDSYPNTCGNQLLPIEVDVAQFQYVQSLFLSEAYNTLRFLLATNSALKTFLENEVYLPLGCYSLTRRGQLSVGITKPPIAGETLQMLTVNNICNPEGISISRAVNNRKFFDDVQFQFDIDDDGNVGTVYEELATQGFNDIGLDSLLPIVSQGMRSDLDAADLIQARLADIFSRYGLGAAIIDGLMVFFGVGCQIEAGDIVALVDNGTLQISNPSTGQRDLGTQLYEVVGRTLDLKSGNVKLQLVAGIDADVFDRFSVIAPSSDVVSGSASQITIQDSYGALYPGNEGRKWQAYVGLPILLHSKDYSYAEQCTLVSINPANTYQLNISGLGSLPGSFSGLVIDIAPYPDSTDKNDNALYKALHAFWSLEDSVVSGISDTQFTVADGTKYFVGSRIVVHLIDFSVTSIEVPVSAISGNTITCGSLGFTPDNTYLIDGIGFPDLQGFYRWFK